MARPRCCLDLLLWASGVTLATDSAPLELVMVHAHHVLVIRKDLANAISPGVNRTVYQELDVTHRLEAPQESIHIMTALFCFLGFGRKRVLNRKLKA